MRSSRFAVAPAGLGGAHVVSALLSHHVLIRCELGILSIWATGPRAGNATIAQPKSGDERSPRHPDWTRVGASNTISSKGSSPIGLKAMLSRNGRARPGAVWASLRGSCAVLGAPGGEIPPGDSKDSGLDGLNGSVSDALLPPSQKRLATTEIIDDGQKQIRSTPGVS